MRPFRAGRPLDQGLFSILSSRKGVLGLSWICVCPSPMLSLLSLSGVPTWEGHTASSPQHKPWEPWLPTHTPLPWLLTAQYPVWNLGVALPPPFLVVARYWGVLGQSPPVPVLTLAIPPCACSDLAYHFLPSSHSVHDSRAQQGLCSATATVLQGHPPHKLPVPHRLAPDTTGCFQGLFLSC